MDLMSDDAVGAFGLLISEACERLVDTHDEYLDKRASMLSVESPVFSQSGDILGFAFTVSGNRQKPVDTSIAIAVEPDPDADGYGRRSPQLAVRAVPACQCPAFSRDQRCAHTLAAAWWLQEQLGRRSLHEVLDFFSELQVDAVAAGRELLDELLTMATETVEPQQPGPTTRLQWRISLSNSRYYSPVTIRPYEQRPRKNGKGWTKGREIRAYDLLQRDFSGHPVDGRIAALADTPSYSFDGDHFNEFQALREMIGHPCVAWDDDTATPLVIDSAELVLSLHPELTALDREDEDDSDQPPMHYRLRVEAGGHPVDLGEQEVIVGYCSPAEPVVLVADRRRQRLTFCPIRSPRATGLVARLLETDFAEVRLDAESAAKFAVQCGVVDSLLRVALPSELAGPMEAIAAELVFDLRPRIGAGLHVALVAHEDRFREPMVPGNPPDVVPCLTDQGPVRLQRDLAAEREQAAAIVDRYELAALAAAGPYRWTAETDEQALDLLSAIFASGEDAPRVIWPEGESLKVRGEITPAALKVQIDDRRDWFGLDGSISIDGCDVPLAAVLAAVRENRSLVKVGDREFAKISDAFRARLRQLSDTVVEDRGTLKIAHALVPAVQEIFASDVPLEATARWHQTVDRLDQLRDWKPEVPEALDVKLRDYQLDGYRWLARLSRWGVGGVLADDMGLGKTVQALGVLVDRGAEGPTLVIAPTSVGDNWVRETERFAPTLRPLLYRDADRDALIESVGPHDVVIVSYQLVQRDARRFASRTWNTLVLDEAQFIKNAQTKTSQAIRGIDAAWRIGLSGTPLENHLGELWSLFRTLSPGMLGSWQRFRDRFADPIERHKDEDRRRSLARLVQPFILRRTKDAVLKELPPRTEITLHAELSGAERKLYEDTRLAALAELSGAAADQGQAGQQRIRTLAWLTKLRQLACHPRLVDKSWQQGSAKLELLMMLIEELREEGHRALVFSQFVKHLAVIEETLRRRQIHYQYLDGSTPAKERQRRVDAFQNGAGDLFLISLKAGGTGLNLTGADYVIHLDPWWNPAVEDQATDRAHRIGQVRPVTVYRLVAKDTIEEQILSLHADKRELVASVLDGTDKAGKLNTQDLIDLIRQGANL